MEPNNDESVKQTYPSTSGQLVRSTTTTSVVPSIVLLTPTSILRRSESARPKHRNRVTFAENATYIPPPAGIPPSDESAVSTAEIDPAELANSPKEHESEEIIYILTPENLAVSEMTDKAIEAVETVSGKKIPLESDIKSLKQDLRLQDTEAKISLDELYSKAKGIDISFPEFHEDLKTFKTNLSKTWNPLSPAYILLKDLYKRKLFTLPINFIIRYTEIETFTKDCFEHKTKYGHLHSSSVLNDLIEKKAAPVLVKIKAIKKDFDNVYKEALAKAKLE